MKPSSLLCIAASILASTASADVKYSDKNGYYGNIVGEYIGCYKSMGESFKFANKAQYQSVALCREACQAKKMKYAATTKLNQCWCGSSFPDDDKKLDESKCQGYCAGYSYEPCGSLGGDFTVLTSDPNDPDPKGIDGSGDENDDDDGGDEVASTPTKPPAVSTVRLDGQTIFYTVPAETSSASEEVEEVEKVDRSLNKAGVAAGIVVGILAATSIGFGAFIFARKQKRRRVEEEYRRSVAILEYGGKKPESDVRLDPVMLQRRMSDGSIADNQDYSRRILKVTNPDGN